MIGSSCPRLLSGLALAGLIAGLAPAIPPAGAETRAGEPLVLHARSRTPAPAAAGTTARDGAPGFVVREEALTVDPAHAAIIICDMWDKHWCQGATRRVGELAPAMNRTIAAARARGVLIVHAPSSCVGAYKDHPARRRAQSAPKAANLPGDIQGWCDRIPAEEKGVYPVDQKDGGCDDVPVCPQGSPWRRQAAGIEIHDEDAISDSGVEIWNLLESRGIDTVLLMGVHTNMCVLGRPFGLRQLARHGKRAILVRDLTDTMYNSRSWPYVSHFQGTQRIVEHIEKYVGPTIASTDLTGEPPFRFRPNGGPRAVFVIGDDEYRTAETLPAFARKHLEPLGVRCDFVVADPKAPNDFPGIEALDSADLLVLSARRRAPAEKEMAALRRYIEAGKPVVGIRTACHAFDVRKVPPGHAVWRTFDPDVLGGHYAGHYGNNLKPEITSAVAMPSGIVPVEILDGVRVPFTGQGSLYKTAPLADSTATLLMGELKDQPGAGAGADAGAGAGAGARPQPVAWINRKGSARVFYTSLGHPGDFERPEFRVLLRNAVIWALDRQPPQKDVTAPAAPAPGR